MVIRALMADHNSILLSTSSGSQSVDDALCGLIGIFELRFPGRVRAYYAEGSYADRTAISTSDIDLVLIFNQEARQDAIRLLDQIPYHDEAIILAKMTASNIQENLL